MVYITVRQSPIYHQMTLEEYLFQNYQTPPVVNANIANTRTYEVENISEHFSSKIGVEALIGKLVRFNNDTAELRAKERSELYETFYNPKKSGGLRRIDAPKAELMDALRRLKTIFKDGLKLYKDGWNGEQLSGYVFLCVDNIELRKQIVEKHFDNPYVKAVFDFRTLLEAGQHYAADWSDYKMKKDLLNSMNFTHDEAAEETPVSACGVTLGVVTTVRTICALGVSNFVKYIRGGTLSKLIICDAFQPLLDAF